MAMLPRGTMLRMANSNIPALHVVGIPAWDVYDYETYDTINEEYQTEDAADNFEELARRNGIKVSSPREEANDIGGATANLSPVATEFVPRYGPPEVLPENLELTTLPLPSSSSVGATSPMNEDRKLLEMFEDVLNEKKQQFKILQNYIKNQEESKTTITSLTATKTTLEAEVEKLTDDLAKLKERNTMLSEEVEGLTERLIESEESNTRLKSQVGTLTNKLQEKENGQERAVNIVESLSHKYDMLLKDNERKHRDLTALKEQLKQTIMDKACAETKATMLADELHLKKHDEERVEAEMLNLLCQLKEFRCEKEREKETTVKESNYSATAIETNKNTSLEKKMDSLDSINALDDDDDQNWTVVQKKTKGVKSAKTAHPYNSQTSEKKVKAKRSQSLDDTILGVKNGFCSGDKKYPNKEEKIIPPLMSEDWELRCIDSQNSNVHSGLAFKLRNVSQKGSINAEVPRRSSITAEPVTPECFRNHNTVIPTKLDVNSHSLNTARHFPSAPPVKEPTKQVKPAKQVTSSNESSQSLTSATKTTTTTETFISDKINISSANPLHQTPFNASVDSVLTNYKLGLGQQVSTLSNGTEGCFSNPLFDPAIFQTLTHSFGPGPGLKTKDYTKSSERQQGEDKTKQNLTSFDILMSQLAEKFPSKTRNELMVLLKLAKITFGDQGFRKKKIEEIVKRVGEIIDPENTENRIEISAKICSICREEMENNETVLECGHAFHEKCVKEWIQTERTCPLCRCHALTEDDFPTLA